MENLKVLRVFDEVDSTNKHLISIVASNKKAKFVFPNNISLFNGEEAITSFLEKSGMKPPTNATEWANLAFYLLGPYKVQEVPANKDIFTFEAAVAVEHNALKRSGSSSEMLSQTAVTSAIQDLTNSNVEFNAFSYGETDVLSGESQKQFITSIIDAAGTRDLNPWLEPWLAGSTEDLDFSKGLVLNRDDKYEESETEEKD
jgi:hypothetical protein